MIIIHFVLKCDFRVHLNFKHAITMINLTQIHTEPFVLIYKLRMYLFSRDIFFFFLTFQNTRV